MERKNSYNTLLQSSTTIKNIRIEIGAKMSSKSSSYYGNGTDSILSKNDFLLRLIKYSVDGLAYTCAINFIFHDIEEIYQSTILLIE